MRKLKNKNLLIKRYRSKNLLENLERLEAKKWKNNKVNIFVKMIIKENRRTI